MFKTFTLFLWISKPMISLVLWKCNFLFFYAIWAFGCTTGVWIFLSNHRCRVNHLDWVLETDRYSVRITLRQSVITASIAKIRHDCVSPLQLKEYGCCRMLLILVSWKEYFNQFCIIREPIDSVGNEVDFCGFGHVTFSPLPFYTK